ncbi:MAG: GNAT family acetyltransferase [Bacillota bacterium]
MKQVYAELSKTMNNHGFKSALTDIGMRFVNKFFYFHSLHCVFISTVKEASLVVDQKYQHGFLSVDQLFQYSKDKTHELSESFVRAALEKGDRCYGITHNGELAAYGWYSRQATQTDVQNMLFCFDPAYVYMYKGFTKKSYRGQRLHAVGMSWALKHYLEEGSSGIVSYVDSINFDSLKSCYRMGYKFIGNIYILKTFGHPWCWSSSACREKKISMRSPAFSLQNRGELEVSSQF